MAFYRNAGRPFITKDHQDELVAHKGRDADILRVVVEALKRIKNLTHGSITIDFGNTEAKGSVQENLPKLRLGDE
jgi:hypothetical protein